MGTAHPCTLASHSRSMSRLLLVAGVSRAQQVGLHNLGYHGFGRMPFEAPRMRSYTSWHISLLCSKRRLRQQGTSWGAGVPTNQESDEAARGVGAPVLRRAPDALRSSKGASEELRGVRPSAWLGAP